MRICLYMQVSDLITVKKTLIEKLNNFFIKDEKHNMYKTESIDHILKSLKKSGVDGLELIFPLNFSNKNIQKIKQIINEHKIEVFSIHQPNESFYKIELSEIEKLCDIAREFSISIVVLHIDALGKKIFDNDFIHTLKKLQDQYQVKFGIENAPKNPFNFSKTYTYRGNDFSLAVGKTELFMTLDTTHLAQTGEDICEFYNKNKDKIVNIHISDYKKNWLNRKLLLANDTHLSLGKGELPITKFLKLLKKENYQGLITMEINSDLQDLCESARMIKKTLEN